MTTLDEKTWSYADATVTAETRIVELLELAGAVATQSLASARAYRDWAYGVYLGWLSLTAGFSQQKADADRLESLVARPGGPQATALRRP